MTRTEEALAAALTEWDRRWREEPERFASEAEHLAGSAEEYGQAAAPYLLSIVAELVGAGGSFEFAGSPIVSGPTSREILEGQARRDAELDEAFPLAGDPEPGLLEEPGS